MSVLVNKNSKVIVQGFTGGEGTFHSEQMIEYTDGKPMTAHTTNPVPFVYVSNHSKEMREDGVLADIAPTMLAELGLEKPAEMTGRSLV